MKSAATPTASITHNQTVNSELLAPLPADHTRIIWIRHGETAWNAQKRFQGHLDIALNETGLMQAQRLARHMTHAIATGALPSIDALFSSDLQRARDTALSIGQSMNLPLVCLPSLRERNYGQLAGLTAEQMAQQFPDVYEGLSTRQPDAELPDGESLNVFFQRIVSATNELTSEHQGKTLCIVVHGGVLDNVYRPANRIDLSSPRRWLLANTSVNVVDHGPTDWYVRIWGNTDHLQDAASDEVDGRIT